MGRHKQFKMDKPVDKSLIADVKCPHCGEESKAKEIKVYGNQNGKRLLKLKCGHSIFK